jgi:signal transduction histidine kinase
LLVALGIKTNEQPFTYPEVQRLQNIAELMDNILTHARVSNEAALKAKAEHLAMMSRGLAHDLKNLLTPVSSFLVHTEDRFPANSNEAEVHADARRAVKIMGDYVRAALFFSERLVPRFEPVDIDQLFDEVRQLMAAHAAQRGVSVKFMPDCQGAVVADRVLLQRMLANLIGNAIDASRRGQTVVVYASDERADFFRLRVVDEGCGIAAENINRVFEPYFTTKEFGHDVRGFGLGLAICAKIAQLHGGTIGVQSTAGRGSGFTIELPKRREAVVSSDVDNPSVGIVET